MIGKCKYMVFAMLLSFSIVSNAQVPENTLVGNIDYNKSLEEALRRNEELLNQKNEFTRSINDLKKERVRLEKLHNTNLKSLEKEQGKLDKAKATEKKNKLGELQQRREQLLQIIREDSINKCELEIQLQASINRLNEITAKKENLDRIKEDVSNKIINENSQYLELKYSKITTDKLNQIKSLCQKYQNDQRLSDFVSKLDVTMSNKKLYDEMAKAANSPYNKTEVERAISLVNQFKNVNDIQKQDISDVVNQLSLFPVGLQAFKEYIIEINKRRDGVNNYSREFFKTDSQIILSTNNLGNCIETQLMKVPYLKKKFDEFIRFLNTTPNKHSKIESEIMEQ